MNFTSGVFSSKHSCLYNKNPYIALGWRVWELLLFRQEMHSHCILDHSLFFLSIPANENDTEEPAKRMITQRKVTLVERGHKYVIITIVQLSFMTKKFSRFSVPSATFNGTSHNHPNMAALLLPGSRSRPPLHCITLHYSLRFFSNFARPILIVYIIGT